MKHITVNPSHISNHLNRFEKLRSTIFTRLTTKEMLVKPEMITKNQIFSCAVNLEITKAIELPRPHFGVALCKIYSKSWYHSFQQKIQIFPNSEPPRFNRHKHSPIGLLSNVPTHYALQGREVPLIPSEWLLTFSATAIISNQSHCSL